MALPTPRTGMGNTIALTHGIYSARARSPIEEQFTVALRGAMEQLGVVYNPALDEHALRRCARALTTVQMVEALIDAEGIEAVSERLYKDYQQADRMVSTWLDKLGMTPAARARLGVHLAQTTSLMDALAERQERRRTANLHLCDRCGENPATKRIKPTGQLACAPCVDEWKATRP